jgi:hypothetical protein
MATIADYRVVTDGAAVLTRGGTNFFHKNFTLPANLVAEQNGILMCRIEAHDADGLKYTRSLNDRDVLTLIHNEDRFGTIHEVINVNVLRYGENKFAAVATDGEGSLKLSDVVIYFQATV